MTAQAYLKEILRDSVGPVARAHGFKGSSPTWRLANAWGDWAVVNVQSSSFSSSDRLRCVINISVAPEPWLRWTASKLGPGLPKTVNESLGLYRDRLHPAGTPDGSDGWWEITSERSAEAAGEDMLRQLDVGGWPLLTHLLQPGAMLEQVRSGSLGHMKRASLGVFFARAEAVLVMDDGPSDALDRALDYASSNCMPAQRDNAVKFESWVREQAQAAR